MKVTTSKRVGSIDVVVAMGIPIVIMDTEGRGLTVAGQKGTNWAIRSVVYTLFEENADVRFVKPKIG